MKLQSIAEVPGVTWSFETKRGVAVPDTLFLWVTYDDVDYLTNVKGTNEKLSYMEKSGLKKALQPDPQFDKYDFMPNAVLLSSGLDLSIEDFRILEDSLFRQDSDSVKAMIERFYMSGGSLEYMAAPMAANWRLIQIQTENGEMEPANPFNGGPAAEFREGSVRVEIVDPAGGVSEVTAYCLDPFTTGTEGWAYWTVIFCKKNGVYLIKETPIHHNRFVVG